jgi:pimeloyl-ACP methyl ester carboxylesterase
MQSATISFQSSRIHFVYAGCGNAVIICFHGYGDSSDSFKFLSRHLPAEEFTIIAIDLPFHGDTEWNEDLNFSVTDLKNIVASILEQRNIPINQKIVLLGFSLGGRICLSLYQVMPEKIERIVLLAPDGLKVNFWYWLPTQTSLGNKFFAFTMKRPGWFLGLLKLLNKLKMVNASIFKFVHYHIDDAQVRNDLYRRWTVLRKLKPDLVQTKSFISKYHTQLRLIYGKHDRIILSVRGEIFRKGIEDFCSLAVINSGHQVLQEKHIQEILHAILH